MGIFDKLFNSSSETVIKKEIPWIELNSTNQINDIIQNSSTSTQIIFKHSTRCGISRMILNQFAKDYIFSENDFNLYYLDLLRFREISNQISRTFEVYHESPQLLIIKNGIVVAHKSHGEINDIDLQKYI